MSFDNHVNFGYSTVAVPPSPATSGTSLTLATGQGVLFPDAPFNVTVWPPGVMPLMSNAEIARVTAIVGDVLTITRGQEGTTPKSIAAGWQISNTITVKVITDIETAVNSKPNAPTGTSSQLLANDGSGGFSNVTVGSGLSYTGGTLASTSAGGSVTSVSVVSANGLAGTVANASTTPAITLSTTVTGMLKGDGTTISAAVAGTDYLTPTGSGTGLTGVLKSANNLSDVSSVVTSRSNLLPAYASNAGKVLAVNGTSTDVTWVTNGGSTGSVGYYVSAYDTSTTQTIPSITSPQPIKFNTTVEYSGIHIDADGSGNKTKIVFDYAGTYNLQYSLQAVNTDTSIHNLQVWLRKNDSGSIGDVPYSNSDYAVVNSHGGTPGNLISAINYVFTVAAGDYMQLMWVADSTQVTLNTLAAGTSPVVPVSPAAILTVTQVANINNTGNVVVTGTPTSGQLAQWTDATHIQGVSATSESDAILGSPSTTGFVKRTGINTYSIDTNTYLTGNQTITLSGDVSGSGATAITTTIGAAKVTNSMLAGSIDNTKLLNSAITIAGTATSLGGSITQDTITGLSTTGLVKRTGANTLAIAVSGTDYLTPTGSGASLTGITATQVGLGNVTNDTQTKASIVPNTVPTAGQIHVGNAGGTAFGVVSLSGSGATFSLSSAGVLTVSSIANASLSNSAITIAGTSTSLGGSITQDTITGLSTTGLIKRTGANTLAIATAGTDYLTTAVTSLAGTANEITASASTGAVTLSIPTAVTFTGKTITGGTYSSGAFNGTLGATTPSTVSATTVTTSTTSAGGAFIATYTPATSSDAAVMLTGKTTQGGSGYFDFLKATNSSTGATNINKFFRLGSTGTLEIVNSAYGAVILSLTDAGALTPTSIQSTPIGSTSASTGAFTTLSASSTVSGTGFSTYLASPPAIGGTVAAAGTFTTLSDSIGDVRLVPQNSQSAAYTLVLTDSGKHILHPSADTTARTFTIPANSSVAYSIGTALTFVNQNGAGTLTIAITSDTMRLAGSGTTGSRTLAANGIATALKVTSTEWIISGTGLT